MSNQDPITSQAQENTGSDETDASRILARQLARPLTAEEIDAVSGAMRAAQIGGAAGAMLIAGGTCSAGTCCTPDCDD